MPCDISEYRSTGLDSRGFSVPAGEEPATTTQSVPVGASSQQSAQFGENTRFVRIHTDVPLRFAFGDNPTATPSSPRMAADATEFFAVRPGHRLAVITTT